MNLRAFLRNESKEGLSALVEKPTIDPIPAEWPPEGGYLEGGVPVDPWGNEYEYSSPGSNAKYEIICLGRDGAYGGEGYDADIRSWELVGGAQE